MEGGGGNEDNVGMPFRVSINKSMLCVLIRIVEAILMSTHNIHFQDKIRSKFIKYFKIFLFSRGFKGLKN